MGICFSAMLFGQASINGVPNQSITGVSGGTTPGTQPNQLLAGCGIEYVSGLTFSVGSCSYTITGNFYTSPFTSVTLAAADLTNPRIDVIGVDITGSVFTLTGTPAANPSAPTIDPSVQLELTFVTIPANATTPQNITNTLVYDENVEWTCTASANLNCASTSNPFRGTKDIEATTAVLGNNVTLVKPAAGTTDLSTLNSLVFYIRSKATWPTGGGGGNAARSLSFFWLNGSTQVGQQVVLHTGVFNFMSSTTGVYQQVSIPLSLFGTGSNLVTTLKAQVSGPSGTSSIGFYLDAITLQGGAGSVVLPATLMNFKGTWSSTAAYAPNDTVVSGGIGYVALVSNTNVAVSTASTWASLGPTGTLSTTLASGDIFVGNVSNVATQQAMSGDATLSNTGALTISANVVGSSKQAVVNTRRVCSMIVGADNGSALVDADIGPQKKQCQIPYAATIVEIDVASDAGTPNVIAGKRHCTTFTSNVCSAETVSNLVSAALAAATGGFDACSNTGGTQGLDGGTTCSGTLQNTSIAAGDWIELVSGTAGGTAKRLSVDVIYTVN